MVGEGHGHFDLKPENVLVANTGSTESPKWVAKVRVNHAACRLCVAVNVADNNRVCRVSLQVADFGMRADGDATKGANKDATKGANAGGSARTTSAKKAAWTGTYLYMAPVCLPRLQVHLQVCTSPSTRHSSGVLVLPQEATGINVNKGFKFGKVVTDPSDASFGATDVFSFGVMLYIMFTRSPKWFNDEGRDPGTVTIEGAVTKNMQTIAKWYFNSERPVFDDLQASDRLFDSFPPLLRLLIEGCCASEQANRLRFGEIESLLMNSPIGWLDMPEAKPHESYDDWLTNLGLEDKKDELHEYDIREGEGPLGKLVEIMQDEEVDFTDMLEDALEDDEEAQAKFCVTVEQLASSSTAGADDGSAWLRLARMLPKSSTEELLAAKDEELATQARQMEEQAKQQMEEQAKETAEKDGQLAEKDEELKHLRAQLERLEGVPPH